MQPSEKREAPTSNVQDERRTVKPGACIPPKPQDRKRGTGWVLVPNAGEERQTAEEQRRRELLRPRHTRSPSLPFAARRRHHHVWYAPRCPACSTIDPSLPVAAPRTHTTRDVSLFAIFLGAPTVKAHELRTRSREALLKQLTELKTELSQLRVAQVTGGAASRLGKMYVPLDRGFVIRAQHQLAPRTTQQRHIDRYRELLGLSIYRSRTQRLFLRQRSAACSRGSAAPSEQQQQW